MRIEFTARTKDLENAIRQIGANRGQHKKTDFTDILVSQFAATIRSVGTEVELPANGIETGSARVPFQALERFRKILSSFKKKDLTVICEPGSIKVGSFSMKDPNIELGNIPDQRISVPVELSVLDTLALARVLTPEEIVDQGLRERVEEARRSFSEAVARSVSALEGFGVEEKQIAALVDERVAVAASKLRLK